MTQLIDRPPPLLLSPSLSHHHHFLPKCSFSLTTSTSTSTSPWKSINFLRVPLHDTIRCMANPRRVKMVARQIQRELSDMLITDKVLQAAVLPESALGADRYLSSLTTITEVVVSPDLQVVKVYVSVFGDERGKELAIAGLKSKAKYVRSQLGKRVKLRLTPEIRFIEDESLERGSRVIAILDKLKEEEERKGVEGRDDAEESFDDQDDRDADDPDEDVIYVN